MRVRTNVMLASMELPMVNLQKMMHARIVNMFIYCRIYLWGIGGIGSIRKDNKNKCLADLFHRTA